MINTIMKKSVSFLLFIACVIFVEAIHPSAISNKKLLSKNAIQSGLEMGQDSLNDNYAFSAPDPEHNQNEEDVPEGQNINENELIGEYNFDESTSFLFNDGLGNKNHIEAVRRVSPKINKARLAKGRLANNIKLIYDQKLMQKAKM